MPWFVLYTKSRSEKKTAATLAEMGVEVYCPINEVVRQWSDRKKKVSEPVFKSYIFVYLEDYDKNAPEVLNVRGAVRFLWWLGKPGIVRDEEISTIKYFLNENKNAIKSVSFIKGQEVRVIEGPLKEQSGKILTIRGAKAVIQLKSLGLNILAELSVQSLS